MLQEGFIFLTFQIVMLEYVLGRELARQAGFEPTSYGFGDRHFTVKLLSQYELEGNNGFEPLTYGLTVRCSTTELISQNEAQHTL